MSQDEYRPSASVIVAGKTHIPEDGYDYRILLLKRAASIAFAPKHCVFPGGALDPFDESIEWLKYFKDFGITEQELRSLVIINDKRPPLLESQGTGCYDRFFKKSKIWARDISLRITALRETFEEVGILLTRNRLKKGDIYGWAKEDFDRERWQHHVHNDASQFLKLCQELNVVPDLWCLQEWSVWRSPAMYNRKFETVYYLAALESIPNLLPESSEVAATMWHSPHNLLKKFDEHIIWLPSMIFYELARLTNIRSVRDLIDFAYQRCRKHGTTLLMPANYYCTDGLVGILPGDDNYPTNLKSLKDAISVNSTASEFQRSIKNIHRYIVRHMHNLEVQINIPFDGHLVPIRSDVLKRSRL